MPVIMPIVDSGWNDLQSRYECLRLLRLLPSKWAFDELQSWHLDLNTVTSNARSTIWISSNHQSAHSNNTLCQDAVLQVIPCLPSMLQRCSNNLHSFFKTLVDHEVTVELKNDVQLRGTLKSVDQYLNIKLDDIQVVEELKYPHLVGHTHLGGREERD